MRESSLAEPTDLEPSSAAANPDQVSPEGWAIKLKLLLALPVVTIAHIPKAARPQWAAAIGAGLFAFLSSPSLEMYYLFSLLPKLVLRFPDHKRQLAEPLATVIKRRLDV